MITQTKHKITKFTKLQLLCIANTEENRSNNHNCQNDPFVKFDGHFIELKQGINSRWVIFYSVNG